MRDTLTLYIFGMALLATQVVGGFAAGRWLANRQRVTGLWVALGMLGLGPVLMWLYWGILARPMGVTEVPFSPLLLAFLLPDPVFLLWCLATYLGTRRAALRWPGLSAMWMLGLASLVVTGLRVYEVFNPTLHTYGFMR